MTFAISLYYICIEFKNKKMKTLKDFSTKVKRQHQIVSSKKIHGGEFWSIDYNYLDFEANTAMPHKNQIVENVGGAKLSLLNHFSEMLLI